MVTAIRPWWGYNLKSVPCLMLPKLLGTEATKSTRPILCSALCLSTADSVTLPLPLPVSSNRETLSAWTVACTAPLLLHKGLEQSRAPGQAGDPEKSG